ncbi:MAG TPA: alpha/beta fold hydrolase [Kofleriaceae bacterium]|nr:alpha/beta fold hydrolase [Kofleriaceae bacterium]
MPPSHEADTRAVEAHAPGQVPPAASFSELTGQQRQGGEVAAAQPTPVAAVPPQLAEDALIEQLSHGMVAKDLDSKDLEFLQQNGYRAMPIIRGQREFVMRTFLPTEGSNRKPIVAFRGTVPSKPQTIIADLDPSGIGMYQFNPNRAMIDAQMAAAHTHGQIISTGHSLGGALAQIAAATFPDRVGRIVTFQAPGVSKATAKKLEEYNEEHPDAEIMSTHHRVQGDLVPMGGQALTPGVVVDHQMTGGSALSRNPLAKHLTMPVSEEAQARGQELPITADDHGSREVGVHGTEQDNKEKSQVIEHIRSGIGHLVYGVGRIKS